MIRFIIASIWFSSMLFLVACDDQENPNAGEPSGRTYEANYDGDADVVRGQRLFAQRRFSEALTHLKRAIQSPLADYSKSDVLTMVGNCYNELAKFELSLEYHAKAINEDPANYRAYRNRGVVYRLMGNYDRAAESYSKALELEPDDAALHSSIGVLAVLQDDFETAIRHLERAVELDDTLARAHSNLALAYATVGRFDEAHQQLRKAAIRGYHQPEAVKDRIEQLRKISQERE